MIWLALPKTDLYTGKSITLSVEKTHYLKNVMRLQPNDLFFTLDGSNGLFETRLVTFDKRHQALCQIEQCVTAYKKPAYDLALFFSPIKNVEWLLQKATELSVTHFYPCVFERSCIRHFSSQRAEKIILEACEQTHRLDFPHLYPLKSWQDHVASLQSVSDCFEKKNNILWVCQPGSSFLLSKLLTASPSSSFQLLIGPEGGLSPFELNELAQFRYTETVSLGPNILRAETAALASLAIIQSWFFSKNP